MKIPAWLRSVLSVQSPKAQNQFDILRLLTAQKYGWDEDVTPENCMRSPTVHAIVTAVSRRFAATPIQVYRKTYLNGLESKERLPSHPVAKLLQFPNSWQTRVDYWQDASSWLTRWGRYYAYKSRGTTGPIRQLIPMRPGRVTARQDPNTWDVEYTWSSDTGNQVYSQSRIHVVRGPARDGVTGNSPVEDVRESIALEIAAEKFGSTFFANGALPLLMFKYAQGNKGFKSPEEEKQFVQDFQAALGGNKRHNAMLVPFGIETSDPIAVDNEQSQFLETRKYQRTVIAGAWGVPPHLVGDLERATFNNVEQQAGDFTVNVIMPYAMAFEAAMERDLLTDDDVNSGVIIRFNLDSILRADFKSRQEGLQIQRQNGVIDPDEWREIEGKNPLPAGKGGDIYVYPANMTIAGSTNDAKPQPTNARP